jgi:hypothetical protein
MFLALMDFLAWIFVIWLGVVLSLVVLGGILGFVVLRVMDVIREVKEIGKPVWAKSVLLFDAGKRYWLATK